MNDKKFNGAPFGVQSARFDVSGIHPNSKMPGTFTEVSYHKKSNEILCRRLGPGVYNVEENGFHPKTVEERTKGPGWARQYEVERIAAMPHLLFKDQWLERHTLQQKLGPGSYNIKDFIQLLSEKPGSSRGLCEGHASRFATQILSDTPGPGTYGMKGIPHALIEEKAHRSAGKRGMLSSGSPARGSSSTGCPLGPGTYESKSCIDELLNKVVSKRGPYDLYSGNRSKPISQGFYAAPKRVNLGPGQYSIKSFVDDLTSEHVVHKGKLGIEAQYPQHPPERIYQCTLAQYPREMGAPGPGSYDPKQQEKPQSKNPPFFSSAERMSRRHLRLMMGSYNPVGPGRYDFQKFDEAKHRNGHQYVFKSKTGRLTRAQEGILRERIRAKDVPLAERSFLVPPQGLPAYDVAHTLYDFSRQRAATVA
ncbi:lymphocyte expansion molecule-like [Pomacea canaliculata]|uniref:lymphocyte expansion molecule-like n=1 Tax=Pomacea canaliculata TaxID=400727 RepID=UPI000D73938A|nr:lymphocyte expansion molecule-like [Pomacea canaliculata]